MNAAEKTRTHASRLRQIFDAHHGFVWRSARRLGVPVTDIDDVVQETFIVAARRLDAFEARSSMRTWLFSIASHVAHTYRRSEARRSRKATAVAASTLRAVEPYAQSEAADLVNKLLAQLDEDRRVVCILFDLEGMTAPEIARGLGLNLNTVYSRIRSARKQMDTALARLGGEEDRPLWSLMAGLGGAGGTGPPASTMSTALWKSPVVVASFAVVALTTAIAAHFVPSMHSTERDPQMRAIEDERGSIDVRADVTVAESADEGHEAQEGSVSPPASDGAVGGPHPPAPRPGHNRAPRQHAATPGTEAARLEVPPHPSATDGAPPGGLRDELMLIDNAERALRAEDPNAALRLTARHARDFPGGELVPDRLDVEAAARCALGQVETGRRLLADLHLRWPRSPVSDLATQACKD